MFLSIEKPAGVLRLTAKGSGFKKYPYLPNTAFTR
jgi:hypothetical protein